MGKIGDFQPHAIRSAAILTNAYVAGTVIGPVYDQNQLVIYIDFTKGSLTTAEIKVEFSADGTNYYQESSESFTAGVGTVSAAVHQLSASGTYRLAITLKDCYVKISANGTGTVTGSSMAIKAFTGSI